MLDLEAIQVVNLPEETHVINFRRFSHKKKKLISQQNLQQKFDSWLKLYQRIYCINNPVMFRASKTSLPVTELAV